jgi:hypothetical protein
MTVQVIRLWDLNPVNLTICFTFELLTLQQIVKYVAWSGYAIAYITSFVFFIVGHLKQGKLGELPSLSQDTVLKGK